MKEFYSDVRLGRKLRKRIRKNFKRYKTGMLICLILLLLICCMEMLLYQRLGEETTVSRITLCLGIAVVPLIFVFLVGLVAHSGGAEALAKKGEKVVLYEKYLLYEYVPDARSMPDADLIVYRINWRDIRHLRYEAVFGRLVVSGVGYCIKYRNIRLGNTRENVEKMFNEELMITLYEYFPSFGELKEEIEKRTGKGIERK